MRILIVEDEEALGSGLKYNFEQEGYEVVLAGDGQTALDHFEHDKQPFDLVIMDLMLPGMSGYEACEAIRVIDNDVPILVLSARTLSEDKAQAFDCGTDQYMTKPFVLPELLARVRNLIERHGSARRRRADGNATARSKSTVFRFGIGENEVVVDFETFEVSSAGKMHQLTTMELDLLRYFIENEGKVLSRGEILEHVWREPSDVTTRSIDNFVMRLRKVIEPNPSEPSHIVSVRGTGYRFLAKPEAANPNGNTS